MIGCSVRLTLVGALMVAAGCGRGVGPAPAATPAAAVSRASRDSVLCPEGAGADSVPDDAHVAVAYPEARKALAAGDYWTAASHFNAVVQYVDRTRHQQLFEQRTAGEWVFRCDATSLVYALSAYRLGMLYASHVRPEESARYHAHARYELCRALRARPDAILPLSDGEGLVGAAARLFHEAKAACFVRDGWRGDHYDDARADPFPPPAPGAPTPLQQACPAARCRVVGACHAYGSWWLWDGARCAFTVGGCSLACEAGHSHGSYKACSEGQRRCDPFERRSQEP